MQPLNIVIFGLSITSSWGNIHATTYRSLVKALALRGHRITFFEKDVPWYAAHRDLPLTPYCNTILYKFAQDVDVHSEKITQADLVLMGSCLRDMRTLFEKVRKLATGCFAFYDLDAPVTLTKLAKGDFDYLTPHMIPHFDIYFSSSGGPTLQTFEARYGAQRARPLYYSVDPDLYFSAGKPDAYFPAVSIANKPESRSRAEYSLGYLGTFSDDRQSRLNYLLIEAAKQAPKEKFCVAGVDYPDATVWPVNVKILKHIPPRQHCEFYNAQRFTLNVTRLDLIRAGYSPSARLFEAGACGTPVISDYWEGLDSFFTVGEEILIARNSNEVLACLKMPEEERVAIGQAMWRKVLNNHTSAHRAREIESCWREVSATAMAVSV